MLRRRLMKSDEDFVDLGLPSGLKWARGNIVKKGNTYSIGEETDYGAYFSWGNVDGHNEGEGYNFNALNYRGTAGESLTANIASNDAAHDAALACLGSLRHLPTKEDFQELYDNTDREWTTINGVIGCKLMKKTDHSVYIFFPAAGYYRNEELRSRNLYCDFWTSSYMNSIYAYYSYVGSSGAVAQSFYDRIYGFTVRAVTGGGKLALFKCILNFLKSLVKLILKKIIKKGGDVCLEED